MKDNLLTKLSSLTVVLSLMVFLPLNAAWGPSWSSQQADRSFSELASLSQTVFSGQFAQVNAVSAEKTVGSGYLNFNTAEFSAMAPNLAGSTCSDPIEITEFPFNDSGNTSTYGNNVTSLPPLAPGAYQGPNTTTSWGNYISGNDVVFSITPTISGDITIDASVGSWAGMHVVTGCPFVETVATHAVSGAGNRHIPLTVQAGVDYFIVISTWATPNDTDFTITVDGDPIFAPLEPCSDVSAGAIMDNFSVCPNEPFTLSSIGATTGFYGVNYQWMASSDNDSYEPIEGANSVTHNVDGIESGMWYYLAVTCDNDGGGAVSNPVFVSLNEPEDCYCEPTVSNQPDYVSNISTSGAVSDISYSTSSAPGAYVDETSTVLETYASQAFQMSVTYTWSSQNKVGVWVDWNNDGVFDNASGSSELIFFQSSSGAPKTFTFNIPSTVQEGQYRMRVRGAYSGQTLSPCGNESEGSTVDFTLEVGEAPAVLPCNMPTGLSASNITYNSADISWNAGVGGADAQDFEYAVSTDDEEPDSGTVTEDSSVSLDNLDAETTYYVWVRTNCDNEETSGWASTSFTTPAAPPTCPDSLGDYENITLPYAGTSLTNCGSGNTMTSGNVDYCGSGSYLNGEDKTFIFTPGATGDYMISMSTVTSWTGLMLFDGCPFAGNGSNCVDYVQGNVGNKDMMVALTAGVTYYLIVDTWASPDCIPSFDLEIYHIIWDCDDLSANFDDFCTTDNNEPGFINGDCECEALPAPDNDEFANAMVLECGDSDSGHDITLATQSTEIALCGFGAGYQDIWYTFTTDGTQNYTIAQVGAVDAVVSLYKEEDGDYTELGCNDSPEYFIVGEAGTYYFRVRPYFDNPAAKAYEVTLTCEDKPTCPDDLGDYENITLPYAGTGLTNCGSGNNLTSNNVDFCGSGSYLNGEDKTFIFTPDKSGDYLIDMSGVTVSWTGMMLFDGCPLSGNGSNCVDYEQGSAGNKSMTVALTAGVTYYLIIDTWASPDCIPNFDLTIEKVGFDCPDSEADFGDACTDEYGNEGVIDSDCGCFVDLDCPELNGNEGDACQDANGDTGVITEDCDCYVEPEECFDPSDVTVTQGEEAFGYPSAMVTWTPGGTETMWEVVYNENPDFNPDLAIPQQAFDTPELQLMFLEEGKTYYAYVRALCSWNEGDHSEWVASGEFEIVPEYDCPELEANIGDVCMNDAGQEGTIDDDCNCDVPVEGEYCDWRIRVWGNDNGEGVTWYLKDGNGDIVDSGTGVGVPFNHLSPVYNLVEPVTFNLNVIDPNDPTGYRSVTYNVFRNGQKIHAGTARNKEITFVDYCSDDAEARGISATLTDFDFSYYPNPVKDVLHINSAKDVKEVSVYNMAGQQVLNFDKVLSSNNELDVTKLPNGVYVFRAVLDGGQIETFKVVKK